MYRIISRKIFFKALFFVAFFIFLSPVNAEDSPDRLAVSLGYYDVDGDEEAIDARLELRFAKKVFHFLQPWIGIEVTSDKAAYGMFGFLYDWQPHDHVYVTPSIGVGPYHDGDGKDLGYGLQFRTQLEVGYQFENTHRTGVGFSHISNAGLGHRNPGTEILSIYYSIPINSFE